MKIRKVYKQGSKTKFGIILILSAFFLNSCTKSATTLPVLITENVTNISATSAFGGGDITSDGGATVESRGICWSTASNPTINDYEASAGSGVGIFTAELTGLDPDTQYYIRAFATNSDGTAYGNQVVFTTTGNSVPALTTTAISSVTSSSAMSGGAITSDGGEPITNKGICWSTAQNPTVNDSKTSDGTGTGGYSSALTGLTESTTYYVRSYATNAVGTGYGNQLSFTTQSAQASNQVTIQSFAFSPATITVPANTTITWTNKDTAAHTVTSDGGLFDSGSIPMNGTYSHTFTVKGTFPYRCTFHPYMTATVVVN